MKDKEKKKLFIESGFFKEYSQEHYELFQMLGDYKAVKEIEERIYSPEDLKALEQIKEARKKQNQKVKKHLSYLVCQKDLDIYFATFTYSDKKAKDITASDLKKRVLNALKMASDFILNVDYGKKGERLHYHAIIAFPKGSKISEDKNIKAYKKNTGFTKFQKIKKENKNTTEEDIKRLTYYINKLTLHSIKIKQSYISTRKGSKYQKWKKWTEQATKQNIKVGSIYMEKWKQDTTKYSE